MAQLRRQLQGDFQTILAELEDKILGGSASATLEAVQYAFMKGIA